MVKRFNSELQKAKLTITLDEAIRLLGITPLELFSSPSNVALLLMILERADTEEKAKQLRKDLIEAGKEIRAQRVT